MPAFPPIFRDHQPVSAAAVAGTLDFVCTKLTGHISDLQETQKKNQDDTNEQLRGLQESQKDLQETQEKSRLLWVRQGKVNKATDRRVGDLEDDVDDLKDDVDKLQDNVDELQDNAVKQRGLNEWVIKSQRKLKNSLASLRGTEPSPDRFPFGNFHTSFICYLVSLLCINYCDSFLFVSSFPIILNSHIIMHYPRLPKLWMMGWLLLHLLQVHTGVSLLQPRSLAIRRLWEISFLLEQQTLPPPPLLSRMHIFPRMTEIRRRKLLRPTRMLLLPRIPELLRLWMFRGHLFWLMERMYQMDLPWPPSPPQVSN